MEFGPNSKGMDWPNEDDLNSRFKVLTSQMDFTTNKSILDLGCGVGLLLDYFKKEKILQNIQYTGVDISEKMITYAQKKHPSQVFECKDILNEPLDKEKYQYILMNGLFTEKRELSYNEMFEFFKNIIRQAWEACSVGISFNVMSSHVDWKRDDLFHLKTDDLIDFLVKNCSRNIKIDMDYGLYEYAVWVRK